MALYERCLVGSLLMAEVSVRELDLAAADFTDPRAQRAYSAVSELSEDAPLQFPSALGLVEASLPPETADRLGGYLRDAYVDYVTRDLALSYAKLIGSRAKEQRHRAAIAARIAGKAAT
jgi:hypothetical protein